MKPVNQQKYLIVLGGPTASGKTDLAIRIAQHFNTAIISCDSRQFYEEMSIGTAKPERSLLDTVPHYFIGHKHIQDQYSIGEFEQDALQILEKCFEDNNFMVAVGGSGMYIKALCEGLDDFPEVTAQAAQSVNDLYEKEGLQALQAQLLEADPEYYHQVDLSNPSRLMRALGVCWSSGRPFSSFRAGQKAPRSFHCIYLQLVWPRELLYARINRRVDQMMQDGLLEEARQLFPYRHLNALQTVGYQELFQYFENKNTLEGAIDLVKQNSRRYAKRQLTWMRRDGFWKKIRPHEFDLALSYISAVVNKGGALVKEFKPTGLVGAHIKEGAVYFAWQNPDDNPNGESVWAYKGKNEAAAAGLTNPQIAEHTLLLLHEAILWTEAPEVWLCSPRPLEEITIKKLPFKTIPKEQLPRQWSNSPLEQGYYWVAKPFED